MIRRGGDREVSRQINRASRNSKSKSKSKSQLSFVGKKRKKSGRKGLWVGK